MESLSRLIDHVRAACVDFPDERRGNVRYSMADIGLSAFSLFFTQSESFLSYQRGLEEGRKTSNCRTLFGMAAIPHRQPHPGDARPGAPVPSPAIASRFSMGEAAVMAVVVREIAITGRCTLPVNAIGARAGVCATSVRNALRQARAIGLVTIEERRVAYDRSLPNVITIVSRELAW